MSMTKIGFVALLSSLALAACSDDNSPKLKYTPNTFNDTEILTSGRVRAEHLDDFIAVSQKGLTGKVGELALFERVHPPTAVLLDDHTVWYPANRVQPAGCEHIDSLGEFESCVMDLRELNIYDPTHLFWARSYLELLGADLTGYATDTAPSATPTECPVDPTPTPADRPPYPQPPTPPTPSPTATPDPTPQPTGTPNPTPTATPTPMPTATPIAMPATPEQAYSATCPCTRTYIAQGKAYKHASPETWFEYKNSGNGQIKWSKGGGEVGGGFESTGKTVFQPWTMETVTCSGFYRDAGNMDRWTLSPCRLWGGPCKDCADISGLSNYVTDGLTKLFTFDATKGEFKVTSFPDPCTADGGTIGAPYTW